ncbi:MAG: ribosome recycling factor [Bdellovibrionota bacterium]
MAAASAQDVLSHHDEECKAALTSFKRDLQKVRTGRASGSLLEGVMVDYYGSKTPLVHLGQITTPEPRLIAIQVYDGNAAVAVEKAIHSAGLGFNPSREGNTIRVVVPPLTEESRKEIVKRLHKLAEDIKVSVRNHRRDANESVKKLEKDGIVAKDESAKILDRIQKQTDAAVQEVDKLLEAKEAECMEV